MKIRFLFAFIFSWVSLPTLFAQNYLPMLEEGKDWDVIYFGSEGIVPAMGGTRFFVNGDTVFENIPYKILRGRDINSLSETGLFVPPFALSEDATIVNLIREDTVEQRVYIIADGREAVLYDFNLAVGDTISAYIDYPEEIVILDSISFTKDLTGQQRRIFYFNYPNSPLNPQFYIEGIGGQGGLLSPFCNCFEGGMGMSCVKQEGLTLYSASVYGFGGDSCDLTVSTNDPYSISSIQVFPNPTFHTLFIEGLENFTGTVTLYDNLGRMLLKQAFANSFETLPLDVSTIPAGMFLCQIRSEQGIITKKFVKK